jgi:hypothetical protein
MHVALCKLLDKAVDTEEMKSLQQQQTNLNNTKSSKLYVMHP